VQIEWEVPDVRIEHCGDVDLNIFLFCVWIFGGCLFEARRRTGTCRGGRGVWFEDLRGRIFRNRLGLLGRSVLGDLLSILFFNDFSFCVSTSSIVSESIGAAARLENMRELDIIRDDVGFCVEAAV